MFKKVKDNQYIVTGDKDLIDNKIKNIINDISILSSSKYNDTMNDIIYENLLSRYISGLFIRDYSSDLDGVHHVIIAITINNNNYNITVGNFDLDNDIKYLNGIIEV